MWTEKVPAKALEPQPGLMDTAAPHAVWGGDELDEGTLGQFVTACRLPVAAYGAQMPDGHVGYGLPIGGVLATRGAVIPYAVGVDIACRVKLTLVDLPPKRIKGLFERLRQTLLAETRFGVGAAFQRDDRREHDVMDDPAWADLPSDLPVRKDRVHEQLGTSGSGNHFVEWVEVDVHDAAAGVEPGQYTGILSHSGSRGFGAAIAKYFTDIAIARTKLEGEAKRLAWLDMESDAGQAYWNAMNLAGRYAHANHELIHAHIVRAMGMEALAAIENHHNFAWIEKHYGEDLVVHRKGATPAGKDVLGLIPGTMGDPGFVVVGLGNEASLSSSSHGAGRRMSRNAARNSITAHQQKEYLKERGVSLIAGGVDEAPMAYKDIREVMRMQEDLVRPIAEFRPRIVLMAADGKSED